MMTASSVYDDMDFKTCSTEAQVYQLLEALVSPCLAPVAERIASGPGMLRQSPCSVLGCVDYLLQRGSFIVWRFLALEAVDRKCVLLLAGYGEVEQHEGTL